MHAARWIYALYTVTLITLSTQVSAEDLTIWTSYDAAERAGFERLVAAYNAKQGATGQHVKNVHVLFDPMADRITAAIPRGKGPDLFIYPQDRLGGWVASGHVVAPLDPLLDPATRERFMPTALQALKVNGALYALPFNLKFITLFYNKKLVPHPPKTSAELEALAKKLTDRGADRYGLAYMYNNYWWHAALQNGFGGRAFDALANPVLDSPPNIAALYLLLQWKIDFLPEPPSREFIRARFNEGKIAMIFEGPWFLGEVAKGLDYGVALLPTLSEARNQPMRPWLTVDGVFVTASCPRKEAAYDFAKFATSLEAAKIMLREGAQLPANQKVYFDPAWADDVTLRTFYKQALTTVPMPNIPEMTAMWSPAFTAMNSVASGIATPEAALAQAQATTVKGIAALHRTRR